MTTDQDLREVAKEHIRAGTGLIIHVAMYVMFNLGFVLLWAIGGRGYPWFAWPLLLWGIALIAHVLTYSIGPGSRKEERAIEREVQRLRAHEQH